MHASSPIDNLFLQQHYDVIWHNFEFDWCLTSFGRCKCINVDTITPPKIEIVFWKKLVVGRLLYLSLLWEWSIFRGRAIDFSRLLCRAAWIPTPGLWTTSCDECSLGTGAVATALPLDGMASGEIVSSGGATWHWGEKRYPPGNDHLSPTFWIRIWYVTSLKGKNKASNKVPASLKVCMAFDDVNHFHTVPNKELFATNPPGV